jgi:molecular chaperone DnaJ
VVCRGDIVTQENDHYRVLGVSETASEREIERAYRRLVREYHASRTSRPDAEELVALTEAYAVLTDPASRAAYDERIGLTPRQRRWRPGLHLGLDLGIARVSIGLGQRDDGVVPSTEIEQGPGRSSRSSR